MVLHPYSDIIQDHKTKNKDGIYLNRQNQTLGLFFQSALIHDLYSNINFYEALSLEDYEEQVLSNRYQKVNRILRGQIHIFYSLKLTLHVGNIINVNTDNTRG